MRPPKRVRRTFQAVNHNSPDWPAQQKRLDEQRRKGHNEAQGRYRKKRAKRLLTIHEEPIRFEAGQPPPDDGWPAIVPHKPVGPFRTYKLSVTDTFVLHKKQNGKCAICLIMINPLGRSRAVDHDHKTGKVRGMLCKSCNLALGLFKDDPRRLVAALAYLGFIDKKFLPMEHIINLATVQKVNQRKESI